MTLGNVLRETRFPAGLGPPSAGFQAGVPENKREVTMEALQVLKEIARKAGSEWYGQWDGRYVGVVSGKQGPAVESAVLKLGRVTRYRCGSKDVLVLEPHVQPLDAYTTEVLRELRLLPRIEADGIVVDGPRHVLESASARLSMHGIRSHVTGRELRVGR
jgi:hypothetical protein